MKLNEVHTRFDIFKKSKLVAQRHVLEEAERYVGQQVELDTKEAGEFADYSIVRVVSERIQ